MIPGLTPGQNDPNQGQGTAGDRWPVVVLVLWLVVIGMLVFFLPLLLASAGIRRDVNRVQGDIGFVNQTVVAMQTPPAEVQAALVKRDEARARAASIQKAATEIAVNFVDWPAIMAAVAGHDVSRVALSSLEQAGNEVVVYGRALNDSSVVAYARKLEASNLFSRVVVRSIRAVETPFATAVTSGNPTAEAASPTPTPTQSLTPTPDVRDSFEPDDFEAKELFLGVPQQHTFYPVYDVDTYKFLAKAGRYYQIWTYDLAEGVDTFVTANVGSTTYTNDDRGTGDLSSEVTFFTGLGTDVEALITVTNRGQFGPEAAYKVSVKEIVPTATPVPSATGIPSQTPVPSATLVPTQTPLPTATATATPNFADSYEPDDVQPKPIALGETQRHSFYPNNDVDKVSLLAKAGRSYRVRTANLAVGVDTLLFVLVGGTSFTNDDRAAGDSSSEVVFTVNQGYDVQVVVEILNRGQYGQGKEYDLKVEEVVLAPTATPVPPSATPDLRDSYEPDDTTPGAIAVGQTQARTFYPTGDVDKATFLAKASRTYRVNTGSLALGVDTILTVIVPGALAPYVSDDRQPNDPSSDLSFTVGASDVDVVVEVRNRGGYGPQAAYSLSVRELIVTPVPTNTPTNLGDAYEPDDATAKTIAVGEIQTHTFYPAADVDKVTFLAKAGRWYNVNTSNLALGVDTVLTVDIGGAIHVNDDATTQLGDYSSAVTFQAASQDLWAVVTVTNKGLFGTDKSYRVTVIEVAAPVSGLDAGRWQVRIVRSPGLAAGARYDTLVGHTPWLPASQSWPTSPEWVLPAQQTTGSVEFVIALEIKRGAMSSLLSNLRDNLIAGQRLYTLIAIGLIVLIGIGYALLFALGIAPQVAARQVLLRQLSQAQSDLLQRQRAERDSPVDISKEVDAAQAELEKASQVFLAVSQAPDILDRLYAYAQQSQVEILKLETKPQAAAAPEAQLYDARQFGLEVQGTLPDLLSFVTRIKEASQPSVQIAGVSLPAVEVEPHALTMEILLYVSPYSTGAAMPGTGSAPAPGAAPGVAPSVYGSSPAISELQRSLEAAWSAGQWEEAIRVLARLQLLQPDDTTVTERLYTAHITWGEELIAQGQYQKAIVQFNLALGVKPDGPEALDGLQRANALATPAAVPAPTATEGQPAATPALGPTLAPTANPNLVRPPNWPTDWPWPPKTE